jgi:hypothetical protein
MFVGEYLLITDSQQLRRELFRCGISGSEGGENEFLTGRLPLNKKARGKRAAVIKWIS